MSNEEIISDFMRQHYTDEKLVALLAHAEDGKLSFLSCCCFAGVPSAVHALAGANDNYLDMEGHNAAMEEALPWFQMSDTYEALGPDDSQRRGRLVPLIRAEIERRERERSESSSPVDSQAVSV